MVKKYLSAVKKYGLYLKRDLKLAYGRVESYCEEVGGGLPEFCQESVTPDMDGCDS